MTQRTGQISSIPQTITKSNSKADKAKRDNSLCQNVSSETIITVSKPVSKTHGPQSLICDTYFLEEIIKVRLAIYIAELALKQEYGGSNKWAI